MTHASRAIRTMLAIGLLVGAAGCSDKPAVSTSTTEATVSGTVKVNGKLLDGGQVVFDPANYARSNVAARHADIAKDGSFTITTLVGQNTVRVILPRKVGALPKDQNFGMAASDNRVGDIEYQQLEVDVKEGTNTVNVEFPTPDVNQ
jgi:hypothetical protein